MTPPLPKPSLLWAGTALVHYLLLNQADAPAPDHLGGPPLYFLQFCHVLPERKKGAGCRWEEAKLDALF